MDLHPEAEVDHGYPSLSLSPFPADFAGYASSSTRPLRLSDFTAAPKNAPKFAVTALANSRVKPHIGSFSRPHGTPHTRPRLAGSTQQCKRADTLASWLEGSKQLSYCFALPVGVRRRSRQPGSGVPCRRYWTAGVRAWWNAWRQRADSRRLPSWPIAGSSRAPERSPLPSCLPSLDRDLRSRGCVLLRPAQ